MKQHDATAQPVQAHGDDRAHGCTTEHLFRTLCREPDGICPRCGNRRNYALRDGRLRCAACALTFQLFSGRWINRSGIGATDWLRLVRLFQRGLTVAQAATVLERSYNTVHKAIMILRTALLARCPSTNGLLDEGGNLREFCVGTKPESGPGYCAECRSPVFGIHEESGNGNGTGRVEVRLMPGLKAREVLANPLPRNMLQTFIYTDSFKDFDALLFSCCKTVRTAQRARVRDDGVREGFVPVRLDADSAFWDFARPWLAQYRSIAPGSHPLYLKEMEFRYNNRDRITDWSVTRELAETLCRFTPGNGPAATS